MKILSRLKSSYKVECDAYNDVLKATEQLRKAFHTLLKQNSVCKTEPEVLNKISELKKSGNIENPEWSKVFDELKKCYQENVARHDEIENITTEISKIAQICLDLGASQTEDLKSEYVEQQEILEEQFGKFPFFRD